MAAVSTLRLLDRPSPNFDVRSRAIDLVVLHYTGMQDAETALARLTDPAPTAGKYPGPWQDANVALDAPLARVSAHYVVGEDGTIFRVVPEQSRAWHAGASSWRGEGDVNSRAIGIEIVNGGHDFGLPDYPAQQIDAVVALVEDILARNHMKPSQVVAHSDIAPERKQDPGEKFPWKRLADAGVAVWPENISSERAEHSVVTVQTQLASIGYAVKQTGVLDSQTKAALMAFQRRFRPALIDGVADAETQALIAALAHTS
ncbi:MAG: N-acetylmuramoyl-L-alanine amidase [Proteobacteria bacterium]|nr:N-acetylmuramoyl-L-alanine amidase [Pseudomonadota bacterium]